MPESFPTVIPETPPLASYRTRRIWGFIHVFLEEFSRWYIWIIRCPRLSLFQAGVFHLPFGFVLKRSHKVDLDEILAMQVARAAGIPAPKVISYGEHPGHDDDGRGRYSILMSKLEGERFGPVYTKLSEEARSVAVDEMKRYLSAIRSWKSPWGDRICSVTGSFIRSPRVPLGKAGPSENEEEFFKSMYYAISTRDDPEFEALVGPVEEFHRVKHNIVFTHGDFEHHNILVNERGNITGFIDWESAGWYPDYWEFTTALRNHRIFEIWVDFVYKVGGDQYRDIIESGIDFSFMLLTNRSWD
ncbi:hypothetical protein ABW19_dt0205547 [Dactylella cylindrospora]|nr:hypothetical protein ABW19_dt0205547 [Dactylella cylindrospora]